jgi:serine/threonine protein kinase
MAKASKARAPLEVGAVIAERYKILSLLGEGATGIVYAAEHVLLHKKVAVKILHSELTEMSDGVARFEREAMATARIDHPNVASAVDFGKLSDGSLFLALEYVEGKSLREVVSQGPLGIRRALHITRQIASALAAAQALEIVHRDLKPENVMLVSKGEDNDFVKVLDFGIARVPVEEGSLGGPQALTKAGAVFGTAEYMPPEQGIGQKVDTRADLYSLGVMLFEMIAGVRPYGIRENLGILAQQITQPLPTFAERAPAVAVPPTLEKLVNRLLAKRPQERIQRADDLVRAIDNVLEGREPESTAPDSPAKNNEPLPAFELTTHIPGVDELPNVAESVKAAQEQNKPFPSAQPSTKPAPSAAPDQSKSERPRTSVAAAAASLSKSVSQSFDRISSIVDNRRRALPEPLRGWLIRVPAGLLVILAIGLVLFLLGNLGMWVHRAQASRAAAAASASALAAAPTRVAAASATPQQAPILDGDAVRGNSADADSKDPNALLDMAQSKLREGKDADAVNAVARVLGKHPDKRNDSRVADILFKTAASTAKGTSNTSFSLLEGTMAAPGAEIVYQLAVDKSLPVFVRGRASKWLASSQFDRAASDALRTAAKIRFASTCEAKHALLPMAGKVGGRAALVHLYELQGETGCGLSGKSDCYKCLRGDNQLKDAIAQIEARLKQ